MIDHSEIMELAVGRDVPQEKPAVSVIIPTYKSARFIAETLDSVFAQTFTSYEVIVVNDASPDTEELMNALENYRDRITFIHLAANRGASTARNRGADQARGELLAFLDSDDIWFPSFLEEMNDFLTANDFDMVYAAAETFGANEGETSDFLKNNPAQGQISRKDFIDGQCLILPSGALIKKSIFQAMNGFDPAIARTEDFDLWMRMIVHGSRIGYLQKILLRYRMWPGSVSGDSVQRIERNRNIWLSLRQRLPFTDDEKQTIDWHIADVDAAILRARGRICVAQKNWEGAKDNFRQAYAMARQIGLPFKHRLKLLGVLFLINFYPSLLFRLFLNFRGAEIRYMPAQISDR